MSHVEFIGPPGVGKSTLYSRLIAVEEFYGGTADDAIRRVFVDKAGPKSRLVYRATPRAIRRFFEDTFLEFRFGHGALDGFVREHPDFVETMAYTMDSVSHEPEVIFSKCLLSAERYQLGCETVRDDEVLCLDESFAQRAVAVLWRQPDESFSLDRYFGSVPTPDLVVHVDAPAEVCLGRQRERGRVEVSKEWETDDPRAIQERTRELTRRVREHLAAEATVITVENTGSVDRVEDRLREQVLQEV